MTNTAELERAISASGLRKNFICEQLGISVQAFRLKVTNKCAFKQNEMAVLKRLLNLSEEQINTIFFASEGD